MRVKNGLSGAWGAFARTGFDGERTTKYNAAQVTVGGETFDSKRELYRWQELCLLARAGEIRDLQRQVRFELIPDQREPDTVGKRGGIRKGKLLERGVDYIADFVYKDKRGETVVEDAKGVRTDKYIIKRKLMLWVHGIRVREV